MNADKFRKVIEQLGYTQERYGELLQAHRRTIIRWTQDGPNHQAAILTRLLARGKISERDIEEAQR